MEKVQKVRKTGITFAPEAGTQRLRDVINKNINEEDIINSPNMLFRGGWTNVKLYFMIGLPTETMDDVCSLLCNPERGKSKADKYNRKYVEFCAKAFYCIPMGKTGYT